MTRLMRMSIVLSALLGGILASGSDALSQAKFVPNSLSFWDFSENWTTNFGPAYRDTIEAPENFVPCTARYADCFRSGPEPLPCEPDRRGRFADCVCTVQEGLNFVDISAILNFKVYLETIELCGVDGSGCVDEPDKAPVCQAIAEGRLIPGADLISTFNPDAQSRFETALTDGPGDLLTICSDKDPYAGCMTAPCKETRTGDAVCSCPVFWGPFQLPGDDGQCTLGDGLVNSAAYAPALDQPAQ